MFISTNSATQPLRGTDSLLVRSLSFLPFHLFIIASSFQDPLACQLRTLFPYSRCIISALETMLSPLVVFGDETVITSGDGKFSDLLSPY